MSQKGNTRKQFWRQAESGQALIEYALILVLVAIALAAALIATGPALGNVFSNTVYNLVGQNGTPIQDLYNRGGPTAFWQTVTAVAANPPADRQAPPNPPKPPKPTDTAGPSPTPSPITPTVTPSFTPTVTISPTPQDINHTAPFEDTIDHPEWWRVDSSVWLGGDDWLGTYFPNRNLTPPAAETIYNGELNRDYRFNIGFDWGTGSPLQGWSTDNFSIRWVRHIYVQGPNPLTVNFTILSDEGVRLCLDKPAPTRSCSDAGGTSIINQWTGRTFDDGTLTGNISLTPGEHWLTLEYYDASGSAGIYLDMSNYRGNVANDSAVPSGAANCQWARVTGSQPNTQAWAWEESPLAGNGFPANMRCNLELRGFIDVSALANPQMRFWDVWDFGAGTTVTLYVAEYQAYNPDGTGGPNWGTGITLHSGSNTRNYAWTQYNIPIPSVASKKITYRFTIQSDGGAGVRRFYIDDIEITDFPTRTYGVCSGNIGTCGTYWSMDSQAQTNDFITTGRWSLTNNATADNSPLAWDVSAGTSRKYVRFGPEQGASDLRIHAVEFNGQISLPYNADGSGGAPDFEGDDGPAQLSFFHAFDLDTGESVEIQWTRDARDAAPDNWQTLKVLGSGPSTQVMDKAEVPLNTIPSWNSSPFRLRFAFKVNRDNTDRSGWYIDNIVIERVGVQRYGAYPFCDNAENGHDKWLMTGQWGELVGGAFGSSRSFTDSPTGNYIRGQETAMESKQLIDFNNDTPENLTMFGGNKSCTGQASGAAARPTLTFWQWRSLGASHAFTVDVYRPAHAAAGPNPATTEIVWTPIWNYTYVGGTSIQLAWERIEINVQAGIEQVTGQTWAALTSNTDKYDDDFYFRIRLDTRSGGGQGDGIVIDDIDLKNYTEKAYKLWDPSKNVTAPAGQPVAGAGNGTRYFDNIDIPDEWWERYYLGGEWTSVEWDSRSDQESMHDHATQGVTYRDKQFSVLEMTTIFDLRGTTRTDLPTLYFWNRYSTGDGDTLSVQVAVEDSTRTTQAYNYIRGWGSSTSYASPNSSSWETLPLTSSGAIPANRRVDTWIRQQVSLAAYADDPATAGTNEGKRIRIRFVLNTYSTSSNLAEGWWLDDVEVKFQQLRVLGLPFFDGAQNMSNWVGEGIWGLAPDLWRGAGGGPAALGSAPWYAYYFDCIQWMTDFSGPPSGQVKTTLPTNGGNQISCTTSNTSNFLNSIAATKAGTDTWLTTHAAWSGNNTRFLGGTLSTINHDYGTTSRPAGAPSGSTGATWDNDYIGRWFRQISVSAGEFTFIITADDGARMRYAGPGAPIGWNILNKWKTGGRTTYFSTITLAAGDYDLQLEWLETTGGAVIGVQIGNNNFSFSDSPRESIADSPVPYIGNGNSSLILDGLINLNNPGVAASLWNPRLQFYTYYELGSSASANVEISLDGGFSWINTGLSANCPGGAQCNPTISGSTSWLQANGDWQLRSHDLRTYVNRNIGLRFRLNTVTSIRDGWWITEIQVNN
jgi:Flp pilus assembly pilin Flp